MTTRPAHALRPAPLERSPHESTVLTLLREKGPQSRSQLSELTGLSPTTITKVVAPLVSRGVLREEVDAAGKVGRPSITLFPVPESVSVCGLQIGVGAFQFGLSDASGQVRTSASRRFDPRLPADDVLDLISRSIHGLVEQDELAGCLGVGVGAPGPVDADLRRVRLSVNLGWKDVPVADILERRLGLPVVVDHNVRSMALAELRYGNHDVSSLVYLYLKTGVALGAAVGGRPFYGTSSGESYIGHTRVTEDGAPCTCGARGCLTTLVAEPHLIEALKMVTADHTHPAVTRNVLKALDRESRSGNADAGQLQESFLDHLAGALAFATNLFAPQLVLVGGILAQAPASTITELTARTKDRIFTLLRDDFRLDQASSSEEAAVRAAAAVALETLHYG